MTNLLSANSFGTVPVVFDGTKNVPGALGPGPALKVRRGPG